MRWLLSAVSAVAAGLAPGAPTGLVAYDTSLKAVVGGLAVLLGARAPIPVLGVASVVAAVASLGSAGQFSAHLALGLAAALAMTVRRAPIGAALIAFGLTQSALRLDRLHEPQGLSAVLAAVVLVALLAGGYRSSSRTTRRRLVGGVAALGGVAAVLTAAAAAGLLRARGPLESGARGAAAGLAAGRAGDAAGVRADFGAAGAGFADAGDLLDSWWVRPARLVPIVAQHVRIGVEASRTGERLARTAASAGTASGLDDLRVVDGRIDLAVVESLRAPLKDTIAAAGDAHHRLVAARSGWLLPPVGARVDREVDRLSGAERDAARASAVVELLPGMLGGDGPRRYFLAIQTPSEARASGGFIGNFGELSAVDGRMRLERIGRTVELNAMGEQARALVAPPDYVARYSRFDPNLLWQNVTLSPDFPTVAGVVANQYPRSGGKVVDGVIAVDPHALAAILQVTGPVTVPPWPEPITADNAARVLLFDQYVRLDGEARVDFLGDVAEAVWTKLTTGTLPPPKRLVDALAPVLATKHVLISSIHATEAETLAALRADGKVMRVRGDALAVIAQNASGNKIDWFLRKHVSYDVKLGAAGRLEATVRVQLRNEAPGSGLPDYVIGNLTTPRLPTGTNKLYVSVYTPWGLVGASSGGRDLLLESEDELGRHVYSSYVVIPPGEERTLELRFSGTYPGRTYRLDAHAQPMVEPDGLDVRVRRGDRVVVDANGLRFDRDLVLLDG